MGARLTWGKPLTMNGKIAGATGKKGGTGTGYYTNPHLCRP